MLASDLDVFSYTDYRAFLRDYYRSRKAVGRGFSYRSFSRRAGLKSPNYLKLVMDGMRNLSSDMAERFAAACGLDADAQRYFVELVGFCQATSAEDRDRHYARLTSFQRFCLAQQLEPTSLPQAQTALSSLTVCLGEAGLRSLDERLRRFRNELAELSELDANSERVLQISFQLYPLSRSQPR